MIYINPLDSKIQVALEKHFRFMSYVLKKKVNGNDIDITKPFVGMKDVYKVSNIPQSIKNYINIEPNLINIIKGLPNKLEEIKDIFSTDVEINALKRIFNYDSWVNESGVFDYYTPYELAKSLDINTCTYCNRLYTKTVITKKENGEVIKITRPEFDHWFPKGKYPLLALSFYNLIPSCHVCNSSVKGTDDLTLNTHIHPYVKDDMSYQFSYSLDSYGSYKFKIKYDGAISDKTKKTVEAFKLKEIYETHEDEIKELLKIRKVYSNNYLKKLATLFNGMVISEEEIYRLAFGTYLNEDDFEKRPLSRMKRDILKELGIIK